MNTDDYNLTQEVSNETISSWAHRSYISEELQAKLENVGALIIPTEGYAGRNDVLHFPEGTEHLVSFLQANNKPEDPKIDICIEDGDYKELAQHADLISIASAIVNKIFAPTLVNLISEYLKRRLGKRTEEAVVKASLTVSDMNSGKSINLTYEGPATTYEKVMLDAVKGVLEQQIMPAQATMMIDASSEIKSGGNE